MARPKPSQQLVRAARLTPLHGIPDSELRGKGDAGLHDAAIACMLLRCTYVACRYGNWKYHSVGYIVTGHRSGNIVCQASSS